MTSLQIPALPVTAADAATQLRAGETTSVELTRNAFARADALDPLLGTYLARFDKVAIATAADRDAELSAGTDRGPLHGLPVGIKDIIATSEGPTTAQSLTMDPAWGAGQDAPVVARLRAAGAVITGKLSTMEYACGVPDPAKPFPVPHNPWDLSAWPGGSSSGAGNGVAAGLFMAALGSDTGGSIRIPAALCGLSGHMPTFGLVPKSGVVPCAWTLDRVGPLARTARDCATVLQAIAGADPTDPYSDAMPVPDLVATFGDRLDGLRIGVERAHHFPPGSDPAAVTCFENALDVLRDLGAITVDVELPHYDAAIGAARVTSGSEMLAYHRTNLSARWDDYGPGTKWMISRGALVSGADYVQAQRVRGVVQRSLSHLFTAVDVVVHPTATVARIPFAADGSVDFAGAFERIFTQYWNLPGNPALAIPMGTNADGMPLSLHLAGRPFDDGLLLRVGDAVQRITTWHLRRPDPGTVTADLRKA